MQGMEEQANVKDGLKPTAAPKQNRGWFQAGDQRINKEGRPRGSKKAAAEDAADRAPAADRLKLLTLPLGWFAHRLGNHRSWHVVNLPPGLKIVAARVDAARGVVIFTISAPTFPRVAQGAPIPEFKPGLEGLRFAR
jgi:hypothetical protein